MFNIDKIIASEVKKYLKAMEVKPFMDMLKTIEVDWAEGNTETGIESIKGKKFKTVEEMEKALSKFEYPDGGYDKVGIVITMNDGSKLKKFRYDHGSKDASFKKQLEYYIKNNVSVEE